MLVSSIFFLFRGLESNGRKMLSKNNWHDQGSNSPPFYLEGFLIDATFFYCIFLLRDWGVIYEEKKELALELDPNKFNFVQTAWIFHSAMASLKLSRPDYFSSASMVVSGSSRLIPFAIILCFHFALT